MTVERATSARVGYHLLNHSRGESIIQIGFVLAKSAWGAAIATEMAGAVLRYGFRQGERAFAHPDDAAEGPRRGSSGIERTGVPNTIRDMAGRFAVE
jgi:Acetyltransferase (GNAT) domain